MNRKIDFSEDINSIIRELFEAHGVEFYDPEGDRIKDSKKLERWILKKGSSFSNSTTSRILIRQFVNFNKKSISIVPRKVFPSKKVRKQLSSGNLTLKIKKIKDAFEKGEDMNKYLSKSVLLAYDEDQLLASWRIYHLHLSSKKTEHKYFVNRSDKLLMVYVEEDKAYFIDVRNHKENNEQAVNLVWSRQELVKILEIEFPQVINRYKLKSIFGLKEEECLTDEQVRNLRKSGLSTFCRGEGDQAIAPMGGGIASDGSSIEVTMHSDQMSKMFYDWEKYLIEEEETMKNDFIKQGLNADNLHFSLCYGQNGFCVFEKSNEVAIKALSETEYFKHRT